MRMQVDSDPLYAFKSIAEVKNNHLETATSRDPPHNQHPNADTIAYTSEILSKGPRCSCLLWDYAGA